MQPERVRREVGEGAVRRASGVEQDHGSWLASPIVQWTGHCSAPPDSRPCERIWLAIEHASSISGRARATIVEQAAYDGARQVPNVQNGGGSDGRGGEGQKQRRGDGQWRRHRRGGAKPSTAGNRP